MAGWVVDCFGSHIFVTFSNTFVNEAPRLKDFPEGWNCLQRCRQNFQGFWELYSLIGTQANIFPLLHWPSCLSFSFILAFPPLYLFFCAWNKVFLGQHTLLSFPLHSKRVIHDELDHTLTSLAKGKETETLDRACILKEGRERSTDGVIRDLCTCIEYCTGLMISVSVARYLSLVQLRSRLRHRLWTANGFLPVQNLENLDPWVRANTYFMFSSH